MSWWTKAKIIGLGALGFYIFYKSGMHWKPSICFGVLTAFVGRLYCLAIERDEIKSFVSTLTINITKDFLKDPSLSLYQDRIKEDFKGELLPSDALLKKLPLKLIVFDNTVWSDVDKTFQEKIGIGQSKWYGGFFETAKEEKEPYFCIIVRDGLLNFCFEHDSYPIAQFPLFIFENIPLDYMNYNDEPIHPRFGSIRDLERKLRRSSIEKSIAIEKEILEMFGFESVTEDSEFPEGTRVFKSKFFWITFDEYSKVQE